MFRSTMCALSRGTSAAEDGENEKGFTLIELMVVIIIIGILAAIAIPAFLNQRQAAWDSAVKSDLSSAAIAAASYATAHNGSYVGLTKTTLTDNGLVLTPDDNANFAVGTVTATSYVVTDRNVNSPATGHNFTLTTGTVTGPNT